MALFRCASGGSGGSGFSCSPDTSNLLGTITTKGGQFYATEDCVMVGNIAGESGYGANINLSMDGYSSASADEMITGVTGTARFGVNGSAVVQNWGIPIPKGAYIQTRSDRGTFNLSFYGMQK